MKESVPAIFQTVIAEKLRIAPLDNAIMIREDKAQAQCQWVKLKLKNSLEYFCFSFDKQREKGQPDPILPFFNPEIAGLCTQNDAVLICQKQADIYVLLIELKSEGKGKYLQQLKSAEMLIGFIVDRLNTAKNPQFSINKDKLQFRGVLFRCRRTSREGTTVKKQKVSYQNRDGLLVTENACHQLYHVSQFLV
ncbi:MAG: hypothetical protein Q8L68_06195 [Methylococcales bacterium]|nr:hypothetical protein [Methylococcales bacterium]